MIYIILLILMLIGVYAYDIRGYRRNYKLSYWGLMVVLIIIAGLRYRIGTDSVLYESRYLAVPAIWDLFSFNFDSTRFEPGFLVFSSITRTFSPDFMWLQFTEAIVIDGVVFWFISKNSKHRFLSVTLYFLFLYLNLNTQVLREALAVAVFLLSWPFFRDGKWLQYYCTVIIACFLHTSAFFTLLLPLCCLPGIRECFVFGKRAILICLVIFGIGVFIQERFTAVFSLMAFTQRMMDRVNTYSHDAMGGAYLNVLGVLSLFIRFCLYPLLAMWLAQKSYNFSRRKFHKTIFKGALLTPEEKLLEKNEREERLQKNRSFLRWELMVLMGVYLMVFSIPMFIFSRYFNYFGMFALVSVADMAYSKITWTNGRKIRLSNIAWSLVLAPLFFFVLYSYTAPATRSGSLKTYQIYYPYYTRLNPNTDTDREAIYRYWGVR